VRKTLGCGAAAVVLLVAASASANGRYPASNELLFSPTSANLVIQRTTFGILISHDAGTTWSWLCEDALGIAPSTNEDPTLGLTAANTLIAGVYGGLQVSYDTGCGWSYVPSLMNQHAVDIAVRSASPHSAVALISTYSPTVIPDSSIGYATRLYETTDDGKTWSAIGGPFDPTVSVSTVDVAASDPNRLYVTAFRSSTLFTPLLFVSVDHGASWSEHDMPMLSHDLGMYIAAVDPQDADLVYLRSAGAPNSAGRSRLFVTRDQGQTFQTALVLPGSMLGFALSPDGSMVYAGIEKGGLFAATRDGLLAAADAGTPVAVTVGDAGGSTSPAFQQTSSIHVQCLATHGSELWACSDEVSGFIAGVSLDNGTTFTPKLHIHDIEGPIACAADASAAQCTGAAFQQLCQTLRGCGGDGGMDASASVSGDGSAPDGAVEAAPEDAGSMKNPSHGSSCGCSTVGGHRTRNTGGPLVAMAVATAAAFVRRRSGTSTTSRFEHG